MQLHFAYLVRPCCKRGVCRSERFGNLLDARDHARTLAETKGLRSDILYFGLLDSVGCLLETVEPDYETELA